MAKTVIRSQKLGDGDDGARGVKVGNMIFLQGHVAVDANRQVVCVGDMRGQTERVFERMRIALEEVGATMADIVQYTAYVTDMSKLDEFQQARNQYINKANPAAGTLVEVKSLAHPDYLIEIEGIAVTQA